MALATIVQSVRPAVGLDVSVSVEGGVTVVALRGEADIGTLPVLADMLNRIISEERGDVIVDLAETEFIDTATLRALLRAREGLDSVGRQLTLRSPSRMVARVLAVFGLSHLVSTPGTGTVGSTSGAPAQAVLRDCLVPGCDDRFPHEARRDADLCPRHATIAAAGRVSA